MTKLRDKQALTRVLGGICYKNATLRTKIGMLQDEATCYSLVEDTWNLMVGLGDGASGASAFCSLTPSERLAMAKEVIYNLALNQYVSKPEFQGYHFVN